MLELPISDHFELYPLRILGDFMHKKTVYCGPNTFHLDENQFENESGKYYFFPILRTVFLTSMLFVLVLFLFSISKIIHVLILFLSENKNANMFSNNKRVLSSLLKRGNR